MRILTFNCHEAWVHQLGALCAELDIIIDLPGRYTRGWDARMRPPPPHSRLLSQADALHAGNEYDCVIAHNITDLLDARTIAAPKILVLHGTLEGRIANEGSAVEAQQFRDVVGRYTREHGVHIVAVSAMKAQSWGFDCDVIVNGVDVETYPEFDGSIAAGIRVANHILQRRHILRWDFHLSAFEGVPVDIVGVNPDMVGVSPAQDWSQLKSLLASHRFYVHTADPALEDGFNLAMLEAMACGLPVLGNCHPSSPIAHGVSGYLADDPRALRRHAEELIARRDLAADLGKSARAHVAQHFPLSLFARRMHAAIETAQRKFADVARGALA
jgi:glycosyltransferase involved in cell wall biosynthesis